MNDEILSEFQCMVIDQRSHKSAATIMSVNAILGIHFFISPYLRMFLIREADVERMM